MGKVRKKNVQSLPSGGNHMTWDSAPTELFLQLWQQHVREMRGTTTNALMYRNIANKMPKYQVTSIEIKTKVDNMKKKYRSEMNKLNETGVPSSWIYFNQMKEILKNTTSFNLSKDEDFDFSPWDDSDNSRHSDFWTSNDNEEPKIEIVRKSPEIEDSVTTDSDLDSNHKNPNIQIAKTEAKISTEMNDSVTTDVDLLSNSDLQESHYEIETKSDNILSIEEAKLAIQKEKLKIMKNMADELSAIHREFLKAYKNK